MVEGTPPVGSRIKALIAGLFDKVPQKLVICCKLCYGDVLSQRKQNSILSTSSIFVFFSFHYYLGLLGLLYSGE